MVIVPINQEQQRFGGTEGTSGENFQGGARQNPATERVIWKVIRASKKAINLLLKYLKDKLGVDVVGDEEGSLLITVTCSSLQILEGLWEDYCSGHLNKVVEETLVTPDVLEKLELSELKLKTTISEEEYNECKEFFLSEHQVRGADCLVQNYAKKCTTSSHLTIWRQTFQHIFNQDRDK